MAQLSIVYFVIIFVILLFGIISLPRSPKKKQESSSIETGVLINTKSPAVPDSSIAIQQAALGKEPTAYSVDQKLVSVPPQGRVK